jgi:hypothetical protein
MLLRSTELKDATEDWTAEALPPNLRKALIFRNLERPRRGHAIRALKA